MRNASVETCIADTVRRILFPPVNDCDIVVVNYPFLFNQTGQ